MLLKELFNLCEAPIELDYTAPEKFLKISKDSIANELEDYILLSSKNQISFFLKKDHSIALAVDGDEVIAEIKFKKSSAKSKNLSVDATITILERRRESIAKSLYFALAEKSYRIFSDSTQLTAGKALWKNLARDSAKYGLKVNLFHEFKNNYVEDANGVISYDGSNVPDTDIWKPPSEGSPILLVLQK